MVEVCSLQFFYEFVTSCFLFSFYSPYVILLRIVLLIPLKYHTGNRSCRLLQYNIITTKTYRFIFFVTSCFLFSFYSPYVILLRIVLLIPLKYHTGNWSCRLLQYNIITTKTYRSIFFHYLEGGSLATWWVCGQCEIWNPLPAAVSLALNWSLT